MAILFLGLRWLRWLIFSSFFDALCLCPIRLSLLTAPYLAVSSALSFLSFPLTLFFMTCFALFAWSVLSLPLVSLLGIFLWCSSFSVALLLSLWLRLLCGLLTQKVLFLVSLATARRVGELQAVSREVSFSGSDAYLSYLTAFRAKTESAVNPLPRSFCVWSLTNFVGDLQDELLLCPVRALRAYLTRTSSLASRPRTLFVSLRSPSRSFSKNALSFFLRDVISRACSSSSSSTSSSSGPSSSASAPSSSRAHSVRGVAPSGGVCV